MRRLPAMCLLGCVWAASLNAGGNSWNRIRYQAGTIDAKVNPFDWNTTVSVTGANITLDFAGRRKVTVPIADVTALRYGQKAYRHVADMAALSFVVTPVALFGILHQSKDHLVSIEFKTDAGPGAVLLTVHKDSYRDLLEVLSRLTGKAVDNWP